MGDHEEVALACQSLGTGRGIPGRSPLTVATAFGLAACRSLFLTFARFWEMGDPEVIRAPEGGVISLAVRGSQEKI
jgi:hypothetical protein